MRHYGGFALPITAARLSPAPWCRPLPLLAEMRGGWAGN